MSNIVYFQSSKSLAASKNLADFIDYCKSELTLYENDEHDGKIGWDSDKWKYVANAKAHTMTFSKYTTNKSNYAFEPMESPFIEFAKAYIRYTQSEKQVSSVGDKLVILRTVHDALMDTYEEADILKFNGSIQQIVVNLLNSRYPKSAKLFRYGGQIDRICTFLKDKFICPTMPAWKNPWSRPSAKAESTKHEDRKWQEERCPSKHQMLALADCFARAKEPVDLYWSSVIALLMFAPGRAGELSYLTVHSLHEDEGRLGVRWYAQKGFDFTVKWVPKDLESMVRIAFERLVKIGQPARDAAKFAMDNPGVFLRHDKCLTPDDFPEDEPLDALQFAAAMGFAEGKVQEVKKAAGGTNSITAWGLLNTNTKWIKELRVNGNPSYADLANFTLQKYKNENWPNIPKTERPVCEALLLLRESELHASQQVKGFSWLMPDVNRVNDQLASRPTKVPMPTIFQRFKIKDENGEEIRMTSHQPRVWLSTMAERGGMDAFTLAQWAGRARIEDNRHYDLRTASEREKQVDAIMQYKERPTALEAVKMNLPVSYEDVGIANRIGIVDVTEYGMCTHDYSMAPCTKGGECMTCKEHICIKGMPNTLERLITLEKRLAMQYEKAEEDSGQNVFGADRWVTHLGWKLSHVRTQRMRMQDDSIPEGAILSIPDIHDPSTIERTLRSRGLDIGTPNKQASIDSIISGLLGDSNA